MANERAVTNVSRQKAGTGGSGDVMSSRTDSGEWEEEEEEERRVRE